MDKEKEIKDKDKLLDSFENPTIPKQSGLNKNLIKIAIGVLSTISVIGFAVYSQDPNVKETPEEKISSAPRLPGILDVESSFDFLKRNKADEEELTTDLSNPDLSNVATNASGSFFESYPGDTKTVVDQIPEQNKNRNTGGNQKTQTQSQPKTVTYTSVTLEEEYKRPSAGIYASYNTSRDFVSSSYKNSEFEMSKEEIMSQTDSQKQNMQLQKTRFLASASDDYVSYLNSRETQAISPGTEIKAGSFIPIILKSGINSDLPGDVTGQVLHDVYDTATGNNVLIPAGSSVYGRYDSNVAYGQNRVLIVWNRIIRLDGVSINLEGMQATGPDGKIGIEGIYSAHYDDIALALGASTAFDVGVSSFTAWISGLPGMGSLSDSVKNTAGKSEEVANMIFEKVINQQPTINIEPGTRANIHVSKDIILSIYQR